MRRIGPVLGLTGLLSVAVCTFAFAHPLLFHRVQDGMRPAAVLVDLPVNVEAYTPRASVMVLRGIHEIYGKEEWAAVVLTHEVHQHVGIYTILGAKMAVRAREILDAPMRAVHVVSETGRAQPLSCAVDGFQVAIGSTLGQGLIEIPDTASPRLAATFTFDGRSVHLSLREHSANEIAGMIRAIRDKHGDLTPAYFDALEEVSFRVWADFDRRRVFRIQEIMP